MNQDQEHDQEETVAAFVERLGITMEAQLIGVGGWELDEEPKAGEGAPVSHWLCVLTLPCPDNKPAQRTHRASFKQGAAFRTLTQAGAMEARYHGIKGAKAGAQIPQAWKAGVFAILCEPAHSKPTPPDVVSVLDSLRSDAACVNDGQSFQDFADDLGYDPDSRKAEGIYRACQECRDKVRAWLGFGHFAELMRCEPL